MSPENKAPKTNTKDPLDMPAKDLKQPTNIAELYPEKHGDYFISQRMYDHLLMAGNDRLMDEVISGQRFMVRNVHGTGWIYPMTKGNSPENFKAKTGYIKISAAMKKTLAMEIEYKNPLTGKKEKKTISEHIADKSLYESLKKGNFKHLGIILERAEGKVKDKLEVTDMSLASALRRMDKEDEGDDPDIDEDELEDED